MTEFAKPRDVQAVAKEWSDAIVHCRIYGHNWRPSTVRRIIKGFVVRQKCDRCSNHREQDMDRRGVAGSWRYIYEDGYLTEGMGRIDNLGRNVLRLEAIRNLPILDPDEEGGG